MNRRYSELVRLPTFLERYRYLKLSGVVGESTFGFDRYVNQAFYTSKEWKRARRDVIIRDGGCDLGDPDREILDRVVIHHMNPVTLDDLESGNPDIVNPEFLICTTEQTHRAIHFGDEKLLWLGYTERKPGDTCLWRPAKNQNERRIEMAKKKYTEAETVDKVMHAVVTNCELLNVRKEPSMTADIFGTVTKGTRLEVLEAHPDWIYIATEYGLSGWVKRKFVKVL